MSAVATFALHPWDNKLKTYCRCNLADARAQTSVTAHVTAFDEHEFRVVTESETAATFFLAELEGCRGPSGPAPPSFSHRERASARMNKERTGSGLSVGMGKLSQLTGWQCNVCHFSGVPPFDTLVGGELIDAPHIVAQQGLVVFHVLQVL